MIFLLPNGQRLQEDGNHALIPPSRNGPTSPMNVPDQIPNAHTRIRAHTTLGIYTFPISPFTFHQTSMKGGKRAVEQFPKFLPPSVKTSP